jgi:hypothetical protein
MKKTTMTTKSPRFSDWLRKPWELDILLKWLVPSLTIMRRWVAATMLIIIACTIGLPLLINQVAINTKDIEHSEKNDIFLARAADYRLCERQNKSFAEIHLTIRIALGMAALRERERRIPILSCVPNLVGARAYPLTVPQQRLYVDFYRSHNGQVPVVVDGKVTTAVNDQIQGVSPAAKGQVENPLPAIRRGLELLPHGHDG